jgi:hypothetical protein
MIKPSKQTKHPAEAERMNKDKGPKFQLEVQKFKVGHKGAKEQNYVPEPSPVAGSISEGNGRKPKNVVSL